MTLTSWRAGGKTYAEVRAIRALEIADLVRGVVERDGAVELQAYPGYYVTPTGKVYSTLSKFTCLKPGKKPGGYRFVGLTDFSGRRCYEMVHRLVAAIFIPNPDHRAAVNHKNGDKDDNHVSNLEWCTHSENSRHALKTGLWKHYKKLTDVERDSILQASGSYKKIAGAFGVCAQTVCNIKRGYTHRDSRREAA